MKSLKLLFTLAIIAISVSAALAFKSSNVTGTLRCRTDNVTGACPDAPYDKYQVVTAPEGADRKCNSGVDSDTECKTTRRVAVNND